MNLLFLVLSPLLAFLQPVDQVEENSGIEGIDIVYVINLDERPERWKGCLNNFTYKGVHPTRFSAINGWKIPHEERAKIVDPRTPRKLYGGEIGCLLSHLSLYMDALIRDCSVVWICEDDTEIRASPCEFTRLINTLTELDPEWDLLYTDYSPYSAGYQFYRPEQTPFTVLNTPLTEEIVRTHSRYGTHSMIFSRSGLQKAWNYFTSLLIWSPIDVDIHYIPEFREYSLKKNATGLRGCRSDTSPVSTLMQTGE